VTLPVLIGVGALGGCGAVARFALDGQVSRAAGRAFPLGTFTVNVLGSFLLGLSVGLALGKNGYALAGTGLIGGFTTFSTWMLESHRLGEDGRLAAGSINFVVSLVLGVTAAWAGRRLGVVL
jgi:CrcB protein